MCVCVRPTKLICIQTITLTNTFNKIYIKANDITSAGNVIYKLFPSLKCVMSFTFNRCLGPCLALCPEYSFILEDELGVCGCVLGILDVRSFAKWCQASWMPAMRDKYPTKGGNTYPNTQVSMWRSGSQKVKKSISVLSPTYPVILMDTGVNTHTQPTHIHKEL